MSLTYLQAYQQIKNEPWKPFFEKQSNLEETLKKIDSYASISQHTDETDPNVYPRPDQVFRVFKTNPEKVKVVILGQDPYYKPNQANGLAFSVDNNINTPRSLKNIFKELKSDLNIERTNSDLSDWEEQGVLLLNTALTVKHNQPNSYKKEWSQFTKNLITFLASNYPDIIYILWGQNAINYEEYINNYTPKPHFAIIKTSSHPSPLSAHHSFFGSKPFSWINKQLEKQNKPKIKW